MEKIGGRGDLPGGLQVVAATLVMLPLVILARETRKQRIDCDCRCRESEWRRPNIQQAESISLPVFPRCSGPLAEKRSGIFDGVAIIPLRIRRHVER